MTTYEVVGELNDEVKQRLDRADDYDCYINEDGDIVLSDGAEEFRNTSGLRQTGPEGDLGEVEIRCTNAKA